MWLDSGAPNSSDADVKPPAKRRDLTHSGTHTKGGKPVALPVWLRESKPQGEPLGLRVWEDEKSKGHSVMGWIEVENLTRTGADFHLVSDHERT